MAVSVYSPNQQTKQQLEELDTLLQRMLALPTNGQQPASSAPSLAMTPEAFAPSPPTIPIPPKPASAGEPVLQAWRVQTPAAEPNVITYSPQQPPLATPVEPMPPEPRFFVASPSQSAQAPAAPFPYQMVFGPQTSSAAPAMPAMQSAPGTGIPAPQWVAAKPTADNPPLPVALWPLYVLNKVFDLLTLPLGPLGSWLRQPSGRNTLGWLGVLMILGAIGWGVADWYGLDWIK